MIESNSTTKTITDNMSKPSFEASYFGVLEYTKALHLQKTMAKLALDKNQISILGLQHPDVITLGRRSNELLDIQTHQSALPMVRASRGGLATIHSYGQLVIYPVVNLRSLGLGIRDYVEILLRTTQALLAEYGISTECDMLGAGLFTAHGKIAFCGIEVARGVSQHGISLNVRNDLELFTAIRSCGIENLQLDRMINYEFEDSLENLFAKWTVIFKKILISKNKI